MISPDAIAFYLLGLATAALLVCWLGRPRRQPGPLGGLLIAGSAPPPPEVLRQINASIERKVTLYWCHQTVDATLAMADRPSLSQRARSRRTAQIARELCDRCRGNRPHESWLYTTADQDQLIEATMRWVFDSARRARVEVRA